MTVTTSNEQEAFSFVIERQHSGASENDIRFAFQRFMEAAGAAAASEMSTEGPPGVGNPGRMDLYVHNTCIEFKPNILKAGVPDPDFAEQLDGCIRNLLMAGAGVRNGILTDGVHYFLRRIGDDDLPLLTCGTLETCDHPQQAANVREYRHRIISAPPENVSPPAANLERHFGIASDTFRTGNLLLKEAYEAHRDAPTAAVKRRLWQDLLRVALGKDAATAGDESDWLFIRHTYITSLIAVIMQQQLLGDVAHYAATRPDALLKGRILAEQSDLHGHDAYCLEVAELHPTMQRRWNNAAQMFRDAHKNQAIKDLYSNMNHLNKMISQLEYAQTAIHDPTKIRVAYTTQGEPTAAIIGDNHAVLDHKLFQTTCRSKNEARYVLAIINSGALTTAAETFMTKGLYGARDFEKHGWKLPIPRYDADDRLHVQISRLGATAEQECRELIAQSGIMSKPAGEAQSRAHRLLRHEWQPDSATAQQIEAAVAQLLSDPEQAALGQRQMTEREPSLK